jgi:Mrp family chromosome partitioning ATPase
VPILIGSFAIAVIAALLAAVGASRARRALDVADEVRRRLGSPVLGQIPAVRRLHRSSRSVPDVLQDGPSQLVEAFQALRTNVELAFHGEPPQAVAIASWTAGEGKSTIVAGLAVSLANVGRDVVVVDADLRRPSAHLKLGEPFGEGLADAARVDPGSLVLATRFEHLSFMPAGIPDRHPADVLAVALPRTVSHLSHAGRLLLLDAPPLHGVAEAPLVMSVARHVIVVVDASNRNLDELASSVDRLRASGVTIVGVVINRARRAVRLRAYERTGVVEEVDARARSSRALSGRERTEAAAPTAQS